MKEGSEILVFWYNRESGKEVHSKRKCNSVIGNIIFGFKI